MKCKNVKNFISYPISPLSVNTLHNWRNHHIVYAQQSQYALYKRSDTVPNLPRYYQSTNKQTIKTR